MAESRFGLCIPIAMAETRPSGGRGGAWALRGCDSGGRRDDTLVRSVVVSAIRGNSALAARKTSR
jgi:hypothetical protein